MPWSISLLYRPQTTVCGVLECKELGAAVDDDQEIGYLYGLADKLILRDQKTLLQRSVIVLYDVLGVLSLGNHVRVII